MTCINVDYQFQRWGFLFAVDMLLNISENLKYQTVHANIEKKEKNYWLSNLFPRSSK